MAWAGSDRRDRLPPDWRARKQAVHVRDNWTCQHVEHPPPVVMHPASNAARPSTEAPPPQRCPHRDPTGATLECDHRARGDDHRIDNLQTLCTTHHQAKTALEAVTARAAKHGPRQRDHPGLA